MKDSLWNAFKLLGKSIWAYGKKDYWSAQVLASEGQDMCLRIMKGK